MSRLLSDYKIYAFDLDGTLMRPSGNTEFPERPDDRDWLPGRREHLRDLRARGAHVAILTNQGGAAYGYFTPAEFDRALARFAQETGATYAEACYFHRKGLVPELVYPTYPDHPDHPNRKPNPGMLKNALKFFGFEASPDQMLYVGDRREDYEAAIHAGCGFEWADDYFLSVECGY